MTSSLCFCNFSAKLDPDNLGIEFFRLIALGKVHKANKFENHVTRNDVIIMSLPKPMENNADVRETSQIIYHWKGLDKSYSKM